MDSSLASTSATVPPEIRLPELEAQAVLLVRTVEESDPEGRLLSLSERIRRTEGAREAPDYARFVAGRGAALTETLEQQRGLLRRVRRASRLRPNALWLIVPALLFGLLTNLLGPEKRINVVANPLAALIAWNVAIYLLLLFEALRERLRSRERAGGADAPSPETALRSPGILVATGSWLASWRTRSLGAHLGDDGGAQARAISSFLERWNHCAAPLLAARVRRILHAAALSMVIGALAGMYARGLLFEYRATWESTFLDATTIGSWLGTLLAPASALSGVALPSLQEIEAPNSGEAAAWIHLYAVTTGLVVLLPRLALAAFSGARARRLAGGLRLDTSDGYFRRLWAQGLGREALARVLPYSYTLTPPRADRLKALLHDVLGARARITIEGTLAYGETPDPGDAPANAGEEEAARVLLFNLAQTPETEVHGRLARDLARDAEEEGAFIAMIDQSAWRERADAATLERRLAERRRTWDRVLREAEVAAVYVDLDAPPPEGLFEEIERAWLPVRARESTP